MPPATLFTGKTLEDAVKKGLEALGLARAEAMITVIEEGSGGFLGLGARPYRVRIMPRPGGAIREPEERESRERGGRRERSARGGRGGREARTTRGGERGERGAAAGAGRSERRARPGDRPAEGRAARSGEGERRGRNGRDAGRGHGAGRGEGRREGRGESRREVRAEEPREIRGEEQREERVEEIRAPRDGERREMRSGERPEAAAAEGDTRPGFEPGNGEDGRRRRRRGRRGGRGRRGAGRERVESMPAGGEAEAPMSEAGIAPGTALPEVGNSLAVHELSESGTAETPRDLGDEPEHREPAMAGAMSEPSGHDGPRGPRRERGGEPRHGAGPALSNDALATEGQRWTEDLLRAMGFDAKVRATAEGDRVDVVAEVGSNDELLTGPKGEVRQALQHLLNRMVNRGEGSRYHLQLEINDFWRRREQELEELARRLADEAVTSQRETVTEYLNAQERRIIHVTLREDTRVKTYALGDGMIKRLAVAPVDFPEGARGE